MNLKGLFWASITLQLDQQKFNSEIVRLAVEIVFNLSQDGEEEDD